MMDYIKANLPHEPGCLYATWIPPVTPGQQRCTCRRAEALKALDGVVELLNDAGKAISSQSEWSGGRLAQMADVRRRCDWYKDNDPLRGRLRRALAALEGE